MAEGGGEFGDGDLIDFHHDDDDDEQEVNRTHPFQPGAASTPYHSGEQIQMQTFNREHSGLPDTSYAETPLLGDFMHPEEKQTFIEKTKEYIKGHFPKVDFSKLGPISIGKRTATQGEMVVLGPKGGETQIFKKDQSGFLKSFTDRFTKPLGPAAEQFIAEDRNTSQQERQRQAKKITAEQEKKKQDIETLKQKIEKVNSQIDNIHDEHGSNVEMETKLKRLEQLKKNLETDHEKNKKELAVLQKQTKDIQKANEKFQKAKAKHDKTMENIKNIEKGLYRTKPLGDLKESEAELLQKNAEDQAIIDDPNASSSEQEAARGRIEERNEELAPLQTQIAEREEAMPLRERIKEIFKKHGVTVTAIVIAAGVTIGVVVSSITKGLKATGKAMAGGLKEIGAKLGSLLPGLIGQVAHFLFNTAAKTVGFLAEHTWLIILAVVAFVFEKCIKKRR